MSPVRTAIRCLVGTGRRVRDDARGATLVEFAFVMPAFIALLLAILQTALVFFAQESLETAAEAAARRITTGQVQTSSTTQTQFKTLACQGLLDFMPCSNLIVDVQKAATFDTVDTTTPTITYDASGNPVTQYQVGGAGDIVIVRLMYIWSVQAGPLNFSLANLSGSKRLLIATTVSKTEPYA